LFQLGSASVDPLPSPAAYSEALRGRVAVVFGGSYGIGAGIVELLESYGAKVFAFSRSATDTHVERAEDVRQALERAHSDGGRIDYIVVTAGILTTGELAEVDDATVEEMIGVNYIAPVQIARFGVGYLEQTKGQLLLFTSSSYTRGRAGYSLYSSTKAAVVNLTQALADEWLGLGVRVNCINPERTATPMRTKAFGVEPPEDLLDAGEVARSSVDVLVSEITGQVIDVRRPVATVATGGGAAEGVAAQVEPAEEEAAAEAAREHDKS
jgi:ribitol-5-phosphate 2-dehydrogenase (NADP+) / D-ribitol-5-phosphate cytidylyltransferase